MVAGSPQQQRGSRSPRPLLSITRRDPKVAAAAGLAALCVVAALVYWCTGSSVSHPTTLQGWYVHQPAGVPYIGSNSRFTSLEAAAADAGKAQAASTPLQHPTTDAPMKVLPPYEPTCIATHLERMDSWGCPVIMCNKHPSCTITNTSCCAYLNHQMLSFLHDFLASKCLQDEYLAMFGTGLGAVRNQTVIPWTEDVDVGITPLAVQFLELNETREELWRYGYALWHHQSKPFPGYWKICPHKNHPSPHFQAAMVRKPVTWTKTLRREMAVYTDLWPMWPVDDSVKDCRARSRSLNTTAIVATPWDRLVRPGVRQPVNPCRYKQDRSPAPAAGDGSDSAQQQQQQKWCILYGAEPFFSSPRPRQVQIGERWFPTATDQERILPTVYGPGWLTPDPPNHGTWPWVADGFAVVDALTEKLSLGAWGGMPYKERKKRCKEGWMGRRLRLRV